MVSDEAAYRRYLRGDESAASLLVGRHGDALVLYLNGYVKDIHDAEDLMIEAFARVFARERPISGDGCFKPYLYKTARNLALRHCQKRRIAALSLHAMDFEPPDEAFADARMLRDERHRQLYAALSKLKVEYREAIYLVYFEEMRYRDAAAVMGKSEQQVTKLVHRGKRSLREQLERSGFRFADE